MDTVEDQIVFASPPPDDVQSLLDEIHQLISGNELPAANAVDEGMVSSSNELSSQCHINTFCDSFLLEFCYYCGIKLNDDQWNMHKDKIVYLRGLSGYFNMEIAQIPYSTIRHNNGKPTCKVCGNIIPMSPLASDDNFANMFATVRQNEYPYVEPRFHSGSFHDSVVVHHAEKIHGPLKKGIKRPRYSL